MICHFITCPNIPLITMLHHLYERSFDLTEFWNLQPHLSVHLNFALVCKFLSMLCSRFASSNDLLIMVPFVESFVKLPYEGLGDFHVASQMRNTVEYAKRKLHKHAALLQVLDTFDYNWQKFARSKCLFLTFDKKPQGDVTIMYQ